MYVAGYMYCCRYGSFYKTILSKEGAWRTVHILLQVCNAVYILHSHLYRNWSREGLAEAYLSCLIYSKSCRLRRYKRVGWTILYSVCADLCALLGRKHFSHSCKPGDLSVIFHRHLYVVTITVVVHLLEQQLTEWCLICCFHIDINYAAIRYIEIVVSGPEASRIFTAYCITAHNLYRSFLHLYPQSSQCAYSRSAPVLASAHHRCVCLALSSTCYRRCKLRLTDIGYVRRYSDQSPFRYLHVSGHNRNNRNIGLVLAINAVHSCVIDVFGILQRADRGYSCLLGDKDMSVYSKLRAFSHSNRSGGTGKSHNTFCVCALPSCNKVIACNYIRSLILCELWLGQVTYRRSS